MGENGVVGGRIAKGRRRKGWHQRDLAAEIGKSESWVSQVERGVMSLDSLRTADKIAEVLGLDLRYLLALEMRCPVSRAGTVGDTSSSTPRPTVSRGVPSAKPVPEGSEPVHRRKFLTSTVTGLGATLAVGAAPGAAQDRRGWVDAATVADLRTTAGVYRRAYRSVPARSLLPLADGQILLVKELRPGEQPEPQRKELLAHLSEMAALAGVVAYMDIGDVHAGGAYMNVAHKAAKAIGSAELLALSMATRAFLTSYSGDPESGLDCALAAVDHAEHGASPRMLAWVLAVCSEMHAGLGEERDSRTVLERSQKLVEGLQDDAEWAGIGSYDVAKAAAYEGGDLVRLGRYRDALPVLDAALSRLDAGMIRHRCTAHVDRAEAYAAAGELDAAVSDAHAALSLLECTHHANSLERLTKLHRQVRAQNTVATRALSGHLIDVRAIVTTGVPA